MDRFSMDSTVAPDIYWLDKDTRPPPPHRVVAYRLINSINWIFMGQEDVKDDDDYWKTQIKNLHDFPSLWLIYRARNMTYTRSYLHSCCVLLLSAVSIQAWPMMAKDHYLGEVKLQLQGGVFLE